MDEATLIKEINQILKARWSSKQISKGKWIEVKWEWAGFIGRTVQRYKAQGWQIRKFVEIDSSKEKGRTAWLVFMNPHWSDDPMNMKYP